MKHTFLILFLVGLLQMSCKKNDEVFSESPSERNAMNINQLRKELVEAQHGWRVKYFPKTDSLLFSDKDRVMTSTEEDDDLYGFGGNYFLMRFSDDGSVEMLSDFDENSTQKVQKSEFEVKQNTFTQLSFTTYSYLHQLINDKWNASADFLFVRRDFHNNLVFKTAKYDQPAREYIVFEKLSSEDDWKTNAKKSYENRGFFDEMKNPQLSIKQGSKEFFRSDVRLKTDSRVTTYLKFLQKMKEQRYYLFRMTLSREPVYNNPKNNSGLGSGYVGTEKGISFYAGIRYNTNIIFYDFERQGNRFVCELVRIYDPIFKQYLYVSKHLYPDGEPTYFVAEIFDDV